MNIYMLSLFVISVSCSSVSQQDGCFDTPLMCKKLNPEYRRMRLPNLLNHTRYADVLTDINIWKPLLNSSSCNAGDQLTLFLCLAYAPVCVNRLIPPCKSLCESVRNSCGPVMRKHNHSWPATFDCNERSKFHDDSSSSLCMNKQIFAARKKHFCSCRNSYSSKALSKFICKSDFVFSASVKKKSVKLSEIEVTTHRKFRRTAAVRRILNSASKQTLKVKLQLSSKKKCRCKKIIRTRGNSRYLIVGRNDAGNLKVDALKLMKGTKAKDINNIVKKCKT